LFPLAVVLGTLYYRTHRMAPSVAVHAALNATSATLLFW
jgi:membrane protease YdiL (CAAX protease family)